MRVKGLEIAGVDISVGTETKQQQNQQQYPNQIHLDASGPFGTEQVNRENQQTKNDGQKQLVQLNDQRDQSSHKQQFISTFKSHGQPGDKSINGADSGAHGTHDIKVSSAGFRHS